MSRIRANQITNQSADGAPTVQNGIIVSGVTTSTSVDVDDFLDVGSPIKIGNAGVDAWKADMKVIKDKYPKPSS